MSVLPDINKIPLGNLKNFKRDLEFLIEKHTEYSELIHRLPAPQPILAIIQKPITHANQFSDVSIIFATKNQSNPSFQSPGRQCVSMGIAFLFWMDQHGSSQSLTSDKLDEVMVQGDQLDVTTRASKPLPPFISVKHLPTSAVLFEVLDQFFDPPLLPFSTTYHLATV